MIPVINFLQTKKNTHFSSVDSGSIIWTCLFLLLPLLRSGFFKELCLRSCPSHIMRLHTTREIDYKHFLKQIQSKLANCDRTPWCLILNWEKNLLQISLPQTSYDTAKTCSHAYITSSVATGLFTVNFIN